jgi:hypothetical protein
LDHTFLNYLGKTASERTLENSTQILAADESLYIDIEKE